MPTDLLDVGRHKGLSQIYFLANRENIGEISIGQEFYLGESFMSSHIQNVSQSAKSS